MLDEGSDPRTEESNGQKLPLLVLRRLPGGFQEASRRLPGGFQEDSRRLPGGFQEDSRRLPGSPTSPDLRRDAKSEDPTNKDAGEEKPEEDNDYHRSDEQVEDPASIIISLIELRIFAS
ncbi:hypothetical protein D4764_09G0004820 [Takifugu flavidus]|uniref:Uncharacterized protein n=1 Tax=Takifugu flavidus TaxID=433684 RepID=A0A5C6MKQ7_9TELE|nr:hypothetical protein D4764_09G0004820 [Takifugu flavidus]